MLKKYNTISLKSNKISIILISYKDIYNTKVNKPFKKSGGKDVTNKKDIKTI